MIAGTFMGTAAPAHAENVPRAYSYSAPQPGYTITFAARDCPAYNDVMANRARNNIMEGLQDLGKDSVYTSSQAVGTSVEEPNDSNCTPLNGWQFEMGSGYTKSGQLSHVTGSPLVVTGDTTTNVPVLNPDGTDSGKTLDGALIYKLTGQQLDLARRNALWVQGGTVDHPQLENRYGDKYGFASLRCAVDNNNADNVEYVAYPSGYRNMFCYAYYVSPAPTPAEVTITKKIAGNSGITQGFTFDSNLSYDPSGTFGLTVSNGSAASAGFIRANSTAINSAYNVREEVPDGWKLDSITCRRAGTAVTASTWTIDEAKASVAIHLSGNDHVTCVYTDSPPLAPTLVVWKVTGGRPGGPFSFEVRGRVSHDLTATTTAAEQPKEATENGTSPADYPPGDYTITEQLPPATDYGSWQFDQAYCNEHARRAPRSADPSVSVHLEYNKGQDCVFRNVFKPAGHIIVRLKTIGGTGTALAYITSPTRYPKPTPFKGTTIQDSKEVVAYDEQGLPLEDYDIQSTGPVADPTRGTWTLVSFTCDKGDHTRHGNQKVTIHLTDAEPKADCLAVYKWHPATTVEVVKTAHGTRAARSGPAVVDIGCADQARGRVVLAETRYLASLPEPLYLHKDVTCKVSEPRTGAKAAENWTVKATVNGRNLMLPGSFEVSTGGPGSYVVKVANHYRAAKIPGS
ncbi:MAG TPA: hypothetical protein VGG16_13645 [Streptosporangiaceae bacterium]